MLCFRHPFPAVQALIALLLAVVALQAFPPKPLPLHADNGPAFSASSVQVALPGRLWSGVEQQPAPAGPPPTDRPEEPALSPATVADFDGPAPALSRAPPPLPSVLEPAAPPRAPPAA